jgi:hypothetical protein
MFISISRLTNPYYFGYSAFVMLDIFTTIGADSITYAILGVIGSIIGSLVRIVIRDEADIDNKFNFFYLKDVFKIFAWAGVGGFLTLVFAANGWYPWLAVLCSPFTPKFYAVMEEVVPGILKGFVTRFVGETQTKNGNGNENKETNGRK